MAKKTNQMTNGAKEQLRRRRTPEEIARHKAIRERFQKEKPSLEQLVESGEYNEPLSLFDYRSIRQAVFALKKAREAAGLSLAEVAERCALDEEALSRIESGQHINPPVSILCSYAHALGKQWTWRLVKKQPIRKRKKVATS